MPSSDCHESAATWSANSSSSNLSTVSAARRERMFAAAGNHVETLHRERLGGLVLPADLAPGQWRLATADEVASIFAAPESVG